MVCEGGAFLAAFTERNQGKFILLPRAKCWDSAPHRVLSPTPGDLCTWPRPRTQVREQPARASPPSRLQTLHAAGAACHRPASPQSGQGWKGLNTAAQLGKLSSVLQPLQPVPPPLSSAVPSPAPPFARAVSGCPHLGRALSGTQSCQLGYLPVGCTVLGLSTSK